MVGATARAALPVLAMLLLLGGCQSAGRKRRYAKPRPKVPSARDVAAAESAVRQFGDLFPSKPERALAAVDRALALHPVHARAHMLLGLALQALQRYDEALEASGFALAFDPTAVDSYRLRGWVLRVQGLNSQSSEIYATALRVAPLSAELHGELALALENLKRWPEALESHKNAVRANPALPSAWTGRAKCL